MTDTPEDLGGHRTRVRAMTGLGAAEVGIPGDDAHNTTGGYHVGRSQLVRIGKYHAPATSNVGAAREDYSARLLRDRAGLDESASGVDYGDNWPRGGRAAWLRFNNLLHLEMRDRPSNLPALRAINVSLDGTTKRRYDQEHRDAGLIPSTDTVTTHTHAEYYRDSEGTAARAKTLARVEQLIDAAIRDSSPIAPQEADDMGKAMFSCDPTETYYYVVHANTSTPIPKANLGDAAYELAQRGVAIASGPTGAEWMTVNGQPVRKGWAPFFGAVPATAEAVAAATITAIVKAIEALPIELDDDELDKLAEKVQDGVHGITKEDVVEAVKQAQREGTDA